MLINYITQKNNFITVSDYTDISEYYGSGGSFESGVFSVKEGFYWKSMSESKYIKLNVIEQSPLSEIKFTASNYDSFLVQTSYDNFNWKTISSGVYYEDDVTITIENENFVFLKIVFSASSLDEVYFRNFEVYGHQTIDITKDYLSIAGLTFYPQSIFDNNPLVPEYIDKFLEMLEYNDKNVAEVKIPSELKLSVSASIELSEDRLHRFVSVSRQLYIKVDDVYVLYDPLIHQSLGDALFVIDFGDTINSTSSNPNLMMSENFNYEQTFTHTYDPYDADTYLVNLTFYNQHFIIESPMTLDFRIDGGIGLWNIEGYFKVQ